MVSELMDKRIPGIEIGKITGQSLSAENRSRMHKNYDIQDVKKKIQLTFELTASMTRNQLLPSPAQIEAVRPERTIFGMQDEGNVFQENGLAEELRQDQHQEDDEMAEEPEQGGQNQEEPAERNFDENENADEMDLDQSEEEMESDGGMKLCPMKNF